jgi:hypothetical protein
LPVLGGAGGQARVPVLHGARERLPDLRNHPFLALRELLEAAVDPLVLREIRGPEGEEGLLARPVVARQVLVPLAAKKSAAERSFGLPGASRRMLGAREGSCSCEGAKRRSQSRTAAPFAHSRDTRGGATARNRGLASYAAHFFAGGTGTATLCSLGGSFSASLMAASSISKPKR